MALLRGSGRGVPARRPQPGPLELDDNHIVLIGTVLWLVGLLVLVAVDLAGASVPGWQPVMCLTGIVLGLCGLRVTARRRPPRR